jgi:AcrR family transcriptional regulator
MTVPAKTRTYRSPRRQEQAAATRRSVVRAARELFSRDGYAATTVTAVAAAAHVSLDTVYASVGRKPELVLAVIDGVLGSSDEPVGLEEREYVKAIRRTPSARGKIEVYAGAVGRLVPQIAPLEDALRRAAESDAECAAVWARLLERRSANMILLAEELRGTGELRTDLSDREVADIVGSTSAVDYHLFLARRGWSPQDYERLLVDLWTRLLLSGTPVPPDSTGPPGED